MQYPLSNISMFNGSVHQRKKHSNLPRNLSKNLVNKNPNVGSPWYIPMRRNPISKIYQKRELLILNFISTDHLRSSNTSNTIQCYNQLKVLTNKDLNIRFIFYLKTLVKCTIINRLSMFHHFHSNLLFR